MLWVEAGKVEQKLFCGLRNEPVRDLNMISTSLNEMRVLRGLIRSPEKHCKVKLLKNFGKRSEL